MMLLQQSATQSDLRGFDLNILFRTLSDIIGWVLARVPYLVIGAIVFMTFMVAGRIVKRIFLTAGKRTRLDVTLADLLGRLTSFVIALLTVRSTRLRTGDGERAVIPNGDVYTNEVLVRTAYERRRLSFSVGVGYTDSIEEARETIRKVLHRIHSVLKDPEPEVFVAELASSSVNFRIYFWIESRHQDVLKVKDAVATGVKLALDKAGIDMPYPHTVLLFSRYYYRNAGGSSLVQR